MELDYEEICSFDMVSGTTDWQCLLSRGVYGRVASRGGGAERQRERPGYIIKVERKLRPEVREATAALRMKEAAGVLS